MMRQTLFSTAALALVLTFTGGCKKKGETDALAGGSGDGGAGVTEPEAPTVEVPEHVKTMADNFNRVFFEFDSDDLVDESKTALNENVELLQGHPDVKIQIQGHADEQGTTEYNLALGQRRAESIKTYLVNQGIAPSRITLISLGEEQPLVSGANERAYSKNRRAEFIITWSDGGAVKGSAE